MLFERFRRRRHIRHRIRIGYENLWDLFFLREKLKMLREDIRVQYDRSKEQLVLTEKRLDEEKKKEKPDKGVIKNLEAAVEKHRPDVELMEKQLQGFDFEIDGAENPKSSTQKIEAVKSLIEMLKEHLRSL